MTRSVEVEIDPLIPRKEGENRGLRGPSLLQNAFVWTVLKNGSLIFIWYFFSTTLNLLNKKLIGKKHGIYGSNTPFPAPLMMSGLQFVCQLLLAKIVFGLGMVRREPKEPLTWREYAKTVLPNGVSTGLDIGFSNLSYQTITLSFYTMCKSTTPMFLLLFAFLLGLERPSWRLAGVMAIISAGILLLVYGETEFHWMGFSLVMTAACLAGLRWSLTQVLLQGDRKPAGSTPSHGGPLDVLETLTPVMATTVLLLSMFSEQLLGLQSSPYFQTWLHTLASIGIIVGLGILAFLMVWAEFKVIAETSALTFMVAGTCKEVVTVLAAVFFFGEHFGPINALGLAILLTGISLYNYTKYQKMKQGEIKPARKGASAVLKRDSGGDGGKGTYGGALHEARDISLTETHFRQKQAEEDRERESQDSSKAKDSDGQPAAVS